MYSTPCLPVYCRTHITHSCLVCTPLMYLCTHTSALLHITTHTTSFGLHGLVPFTGTKPTYISAHICESSPHLACEKSGFTHVLERCNQVSKPCLLTSRVAAHAPHPKDIHTPSPSACLSSRCAVPVTSCLPNATVCLRSRSQVTHEQDPDHSRSNILVTIDKDPDRT